MSPSLQDNSLEFAMGGRSILWADIRSLLKLAAPIIGITLSRMLMGFADFYQVSFLGTAATAAISPATMFVFAGICLAAGAVTSVQTYASQSVGRGKPSEAAAYAWQTFYIALAAVPVAAIMSLLSDTVWRTIDAPPDVQSLQIAYCRVAFWSLPFGVLCAGLEGFFNGVQKSSVALRAILAALACNVVGNYLLIFGAFGFPRLGIAGAAIATVIGWILRFAILFSVFLSRAFRERYHTHESWRFHMEKLRGVIRVGGPTAIQWFLDIGAWFLFLSVLIQGFGTEILAASNTGLQYMHVAFMPAIGVGIALCSFVGRSIGEGRPEVAIRKTRAALLIAVLYMGFIGLVFVVMPRPLMRLVSLDPAVIEAGRSVLIWAALFQVSDAFCIIYINALRGAGDTHWPAIALVTLCWTLFLGGGYVVATLAPGWGHNGPWMMCTAYISILGLVLWRRFVGGAWKSINLFKQVEPADAKPRVDSDALVNVAEQAADAGLPT